MRPGSLVSRQTPPLPELLRRLSPDGVVDQVPETPRGEHDPATLAGARRLAMTHFSTRYTTTDEHLREANGIHDDVIALEDLDRVPVDPAIC